MATDAYKDRLMLRALMLLLEGVYLRTSGYKSSQEEATELVSKIAAELAGQTKAEATR